MINESEATELEMWQARCDELQVASERLREERDNARSTAALMEAEVAKQTQIISELNAQVDRLRIHIQQGVEL
jgi:outer membrane murein-binding lipoprotein Lpp